ncbi:MAG: tRNA pseudouridine(13) synthase TruD [Thermoplasmataceae archaeon]
MDEKYGVEGFVSDLPCIDGRIKDSPEDFIVEEIPVEMQRADPGKFLILKVRLREWDTNRFLIELSRQLGVSRKRITYAGTKDKFAVTTQYFCINTESKAETFKAADAEILDSFRSDHMIRLGDLRGNRFTIRISGENEPSDLSDAIMPVYEQVNARGGFPNFFGPQRFGSIRSNTHTIGKLLVKGEYESAVRRYIYDPDYDTDDFRVQFNIHNDPVQALKEFPLHLHYERSLLGYMAEHGGAEGAFSNLPKNLSIMFVHAYQSYLFNRMLSMRLGMLGNLATAVEGDFVLPVDRLFNPAGDPVKVTRFNIDKLNSMAVQGRVRPLMQLFGYHSEFTGGETGEIEHKVLELEGVDPSEFFIKGHPELSSTGSKRVTSFMPADFSISSGRTLTFSLGRGIYATSLTREILKKF